MSKYDSIQFFLHYANEAVDEVFDALRFDRNDRDLQRTIAEIHASGGFLPKGRTGELVAAIGKESHQLFENAIGEAIESGHASYLLPKLESLNRDLERLRNEALEATSHGFVCDGITAHEAVFRSVIIEVGNVVVRLANKGERSPNPDQGSQERDASEADVTATQNAQTRDQRRAEWLAKAMLLVAEHPEWTDARIAREVTVHPSQLSRSAVFKKARELARGDGTPKRGRVKVDPDSGPSDVEAYDNDDPAKRDWD